MAVQNLAVEQAHYNLFLLREFGLHHFYMLLVSGTS